MEGRVCKLRHVFVDVLCSACLSRWRPTWWIVSVLISCVRPVCYGHPRCSRLLFIPNTSAILSCWGHARCNYLYTGIQLLINWYNTSTRTAVYTSTNDTVGQRRFTPRPSFRRSSCLGFASFWSVGVLQRLQEELKEIALKKCDDSVAKFAACAKEKGMWVVFSCREQNRQSE